ncbi:Beta-galactosidase C-terminal domain [Streptomyces tibetensis]|uniref:Beta-galactosidase C-terminal domain n=1 Tax=Streptomyces tibetensis TaxID=2382123 RepID=UPI00340E0D71
MMRKIRYGGDHNPEHPSRASASANGTPAQRSSPRPSPSWGRGPGSSSRSCSRAAPNRIDPDGTRLLFLPHHAPEAAHLTAHGTATDLLTGKRGAEGEPPVLDPLGVAILQWIRRPRSSGTPEARKK